MKDAKDAKDTRYGGSTVALVTRELDESHDVAGAGLVLDDVLVEDVSIDGMCGVY
jgi:mycofactocin precursor